MVIHGLIDRSTVNGPGARTAVFLQGCSLQCPGCQNPDTHHRKSGTQMTYGALAEWILSREGVTGVTFSGGEPLEQLDDGLDLVIEILREVHSDFSIGIFTGYTLTELNAGKFRSTWNAKTKIANYKKAEAWAWVKKKIDWAVTGRYNQLQPCNEPMRSSENQRCGGGAIGAAGAGGAGWGSAQVECHWRAIGQRCSVLFIGRNGGGNRARKRAVSAAGRAGATGHSGGSEHPREHGAGLPRPEPPFDNRIATK